jgi:adenylosuccinate synthase
MSSNKQISVLVGLQNGDEGKGKISNYLASQNNYDAYVRFNGGPNAGHTIYVNDTKIVLHQIPCGILQNKYCLISSGCVVDISKLNNEADMLINIGIDVRKYLYIAYNAHIITDECIEIDRKTDRIGTTGSGIGPTYSRKSLRTGLRMCDIETNYNIIEPYQFIFRHKNIFMEGAQGFELDIDNGDYPYVTSSSCITGAIFTNGVHPSISPKVYGVCKLYETYVGAKEFQPDDPIFEDLQQIGYEYGATTGRPRQCNWLDITRLEKAIILNGVTTLYVNKCDVIQNLGAYFVILNGRQKEFSTYDDMIYFVRCHLEERTPVETIIFSGNPKGI